MQNNHVDILIPVAKQGGVENVVNTTASYLMRQGFKIRIIQLVWEGFDWTLPEADFFPLLRGRDGHDLEEFAQVLSSFWEDNGEPDLVLATGWPYACFVAKEALFRCKSSAVVVSWLHSQLKRYENAGYGNIEALEFADFHLAISTHIANEIRANGGRKPIFRINNPINLSNLPTLPRTPEGRRKNLIFVGRFDENKHVDTILKALAKASPKWDLHLFGTGEDSTERDLKKLIKLLNLKEYVHFHGWSANPWEKIDHADGLVMASEYEGFPLCAMEAAACGLPVISTPVSGITDIITPGENGYLFPVNDSDLLAEILNAMESGVLPAISDEICRERILQFDENVALNDLFIKLKFMISEPEKLSTSHGSGRIAYHPDDKISVVIPCYNVEKYLSECLDSIMNQDFPKGMYEVICINDASTDNTLDVLAEYESRYPDNLMIINLSENTGQGGARNIGTYDYASGNFITYIDSDDCVTSDYLKILYENLGVYDADMSMASFREFDDAGHKIEMTNDSAFFDMKNPNQKKHYLLLNSTKTSPWSKLYKRDFIVENNILFPEKIFMEDIYFTLLYSMCSSCINVISDPIYQYRYNTSGTMFDEEKKYKRQEMIYAVTELTLNELTNRGLIEPYEDELALFYYIKAYVSLIPDQDVKKLRKDRIHLLCEVKEKALKRFPGILSNPYILSDTSKHNREMLEYFKAL